MTMPQEIDTERLLLRPIQSSDADRIAELMVFDVARYLTTVPWPYTHADAVAFTDRMSGAQGQYAATHAGQFIGVIGGSRMLGYWYGRAFWGQGFATEAARALRDVWFRQTNAWFLRSGNVVANQASAHVLEKLGLQRSGFRMAHLNRDRGRTLLETRCLMRHDWEALH